MKHNWTLFINVFCTIIELYVHIYYCIFISIWTSLNKYTLVYIYYYSRYIDLQPILSRVKTYNKSCQVINMSSGASKNCYIWVYCVAAEVHVDRSPEHMGDHCTGAFIMNTCILIPMFVISFTSMCCSFEEYVLQFWRVCIAVTKNTCCSFEEYVLQLLRIRVAVLRSMYCSY